MEESKAEAIYGSSLTFGSDALVRFTGSARLVPLTLRDCYARLDDITALVRGRAPRSSRPSARAPTGTAAP